VAATVTGAPGGVTSRLCQGLVVTATDAGLLIVGGGRRQLFTGSAARDLLPRLVPLLDGEYNPEAICAAADCTPAELSQVLTALDGCGLIEGGVSAGRDASRPVLGHVAAYLSRTVRTTGVHRSSGDLRVVLSDAAVLVVSADGTADSVVADLLENGVGEASAADRAERAAAWRPQLGGRYQRAVVVVRDDSAEHDQLAEAISALDGTGTPVLRVAGRGPDLEIGPLFCGDLTACFECFRTAWQLSRGHPAAHTGVAGPPATEAAVAAGILSGLVTAEILAVLAHLTRPASAGAFARMSLPDCSYERWPVVPAAGCVACGLQALDEVPPAEVYEHALELPAISVSRAPASIREASFQAACQRPRILVSPYSPRAAMAAARPTPAQSSDLACGRPAIDPRVIGTLLRDMAAAQEKWTTSGYGALDVYVVTDVPVVGVLASILKYDPTDDEFFAVRADLIPADRWLSETDLGAAAAGWVIILAGALARMPGGENDAAFRTLHLEAGCAIVQLAESCAREDLTIRLASAWSAQIAELLELDTRREVVIAMADIGMKRSCSR
jgi:bacteriocin biosynthesis cyclodehydratase domain-containing protein